MCPTTATCESIDNCLFCLGASSQNISGWQYMQFLFVHVYWPTQKELVSKIQVFSKGDKLCLPDEVPLLYQGVGCFSLAIF